MEALMTTYLGVDLARGGKNPTRVTVAELLIRGPGGGSGDLADSMGGGA